MLRFFRDTHFPFISWRRYAYLFSLAILLPGMASLLIKGGPKYGIDFTGGTLVQLRFAGPVPLDQLRARLTALDLDAFELQRFGDEREVVIRARGEPGAEAELAPRIARALQQDPQLRANGFEVVRVEAVGPKIGSELQRKALLALAYSCGLIILYIYVRFKGLKYGVTPVIALVHDTLLTVGVFSLLNKEITLDVVAALLTVIGYSVNDSIVVLDRIRENLRTRQRRSLEETIDAAVNQTLSRTVITGVSTLLVVLALFFVGGRVIHDFAFALLVGIVVGTYSSIFVVAPLLVEWERWFGGKAPPKAGSGTPRAAGAPGEPLERPARAPLATAGRRRRG
ncbi:MAG: protein translocase subunit SecF [Gemmatimonadota bacterium]